MCNRARTRSEPGTWREEFGITWIADRPMDNRFTPAELAPTSRNWIVRKDDRGRGLDVMTWDVLGGQAKFPMTNVRNLALPQWRRLAAKPENRCLIPLTEFAEFTPEAFDLGDGKKPLKGEMWFAVTDQPMFAVAGFWQQVGDQKSFAMVTCDPNELVAPIHPKAMVTILHREDWDEWLRCDLDDVVKLQRPYPADRMTVRGPVFPTREQKHLAVNREQELWACALQVVKHHGNSVDVLFAERVNTLAKAADVVGVERWKAIAACVDQL